MPITIWGLAVELRHKNITSLIFVYNKDDIWAANAIYEYYTDILC